MEDNKNVSGIRLYCGDVIRVSPDVFNNEISIKFKNKFALEGVVKNKKWWQFWKKLRILAYDLRFIGQNLTFINDKPKIYVRSKI